MSLHVLCIINLMCKFQSLEYWFYVRKDAINLMYFKIILFSIVFGVILTMNSVMTMPSPIEQIRQRWQIMPDGSIDWKVKSGNHSDHIEMSGRKVSVIVNYGVDENGNLSLSRTIIWPMLRTIPNNTHASLAHIFDINAFPKVTIDGKPIANEKPYEFNIRGMLTIKSKAADGISVSRRLFPSTKKAAMVENCIITNDSCREHTVEIGRYEDIYKTDPAKGVYGEYILTAKTIGSKRVVLKPGEKAKFSVIFSGRRTDEAPRSFDPEYEEKLRRNYVNSIFDNLVFECPDPILCREFNFAKVRAAESIFETKGGLMHGPGGGAYYPAIWANDQAEYANPFFPFLGDEAGNKSAENSYKMFAKYMKPDYQPVPSSIIAEGTDIWCGAGDRGDAAMIAYGASRFALESGDRKLAEEIWPTVKWCLEYCRRKTDAEGVVESDCDELERRFPAGKANLCTSSLTYDALHSAAYLGKELGVPKSEIDDYNCRAGSLRIAIEKYFGANIDGFNTYRYYDGNTTLRAWICIPLAMGIYERKKGTIEALFSPKLWTDDGIATEAGKETFWDRATLYALRGVFFSGETELGIDYLKKYSKRRLFGEHVPYPVEAWPEGNQRHLSAESALYCRVITEGLWGIRPVGLHSFTCTPRLPNGWNKMALRNIKAFGSKFDAVVYQKDSRLFLEITQGKQRTVCNSIEPGQIVSVMLKHCD